MCSNTCECNPIEAGSSLSNNSSRSCRKCGGTPYIILDKVHIHCKECFLEFCNRKIRSTIGKSKLVKNNDPILIAYSGGPSSCALVDLIWNSIQSTTGRQQNFRPSLLHVDVQSLLQDEHHEIDTETRVKNLSRLLDRLSTTYPAWPIYWSTIESSFCPAESSGQLLQYATYDRMNRVEHHLHLMDDPTASHKMWDSVRAKRDPTDRQQYVRDKIAEYINYLASRISASRVSPQGDCSLGSISYLFTASSSDRLANNLLVDVIIGRGATICNAVRVCDPRPEIPLMRPMRDFSKKEVVFYLHARGLLPQVVPDKLTSKSRKSSIQVATENFLTKLYVDYPSTYSTLLRTGNKMQD